MCEVVLWGALFGQGCTQSAAVLSRQITDHLATPIVSRFEQAKPYIRVLRQVLSTEGKHLRRFQEIQLTVERRVTMKFILDGMEKKEELGTWRHSLDDGKIIITIDEIKN